MNIVCTRKMVALLLFLVFPAFSFAESDGSIGGQMSCIPVEGTTNPILPIVKKLRVTSVKVRGIQVLSRQILNYYYSNWTLAIPVEAQPEPCMAVVGQDGTDLISPVGLRSMYSAECMAAMPPPLQVRLTFSISVLTSLISYQPIQTKVITLNGAGTYLVTLDARTETVSMLKIAP